MMVINFLLFAIWLTVFPWAVGLIFHRWYVGEQRLSWLKTYVFGLMTEFVIFQIIAVCLTFMKSSLSLLTVLWLISCGIMITLGVWTWISRKKIYVAKKERGRRKRLLKKSNWENYLVAMAVVALVAFQVIFVTLHVHEDLDDAWYVGTAVMSYFTDTLNLISPYSGEIMAQFPMDYVLSPWPIFCAMLGRLSFIHPAIIMHTFIPIIMIPLCYVIYFLLGEKYLNKIRIGHYGCFCYMFIEYYGNWSIRSTSTFCCFRIWQGKAILSNWLIPLIICVFIYLVNDRE